MTKIKNSLLPTEKDKQRLEWKSKLDKAMIAYADVRNSMNRYEELYEGTREVDGNQNTGKSAVKLANNVRNIVYELVESQVDSSIPMPKVTAIHEEDERIAKIIENALLNKIKMMDMEVLNDAMERTTPIQGADFFHVEWDNTKGLHTNVGDVVISERHPRQIIPQPGVVDIEKMDYIFVLMSQTKDYIKRKYGVNVSSAEEEFKDIRREENQSNVEDVVTINIVYYRNKKNGIGIYSWCDDYTLEDIDDYQARRLTKCEKCGHVKNSDEKKCPECGGKYVVDNDDFEEIDFLMLADIMPDSAEALNKALDNGGTVSVPYYKPNCYPLIERKNVTKNGAFLGTSDVDVIKDQQDIIKKLLSKSAEKLLKGGSIVTLPMGVGIETTDQEMKIVRLKDPAQKALIGVIPLQASVTQDLSMADVEYNYAKSVLGITDAYQGKYDSSATSGTAKQYSINQAAGRLESKRVMKNLAYSKLYEMIFKFWLSCADQPIQVSATGVNGEREYMKFDRYMFLKIDDAGDFYWNDEFIFETDPTSTLMANREAMWQQADMKLQSGAFGPIGDMQTNLMYWTFMEKNNYPNAAEIKKQVELRLAEQQNMMQSAQEQQSPIQQGNVPGDIPPELLAQMGGSQNVMPQM